MKEENKTVAVCEGCFSVVRYDYVSMQTQCDNRECENFGKRLYSKGYYINNRPAYGQISK